MADPANQVTIQGIRERYPQYGDMSDEALVSALHNKYYSDMPLADFQAKVGYKTAQAPAEQHASLTNPADLAVGSGEALLAGVKNILPTLGNAASDLIHGGNETPAFQTSPMGDTAQDLAHQIGQSAPGQFVQQKVKQLTDRFNQNSADFRGDLVRNGLRVMSDMAQVSQGANPLQGGAKDAAESAVVPPTPPESFKAGYRTAADHPIAAGAAGQSGIDALTLHNQQIGNLRMGNDAGVAQGNQLSHEALQEGAEAPNSVFNRAANALPTMPLSPENATAVNGIGVNDLVTHTPDAQAILAANKTRLTSGPLSGDQAIDNLRALRQEGFARIGAPAADVEQQNLGRAQLRMADVLENHISDNLPANGDVSLDQFQDARTALAKNHAVAGALHGNNIDMSAIARMQNASPGLLTGELRVGGDFANAHPAVSGLGSHVEVPPSMSNDLGKAMGASAQSLTGRLFEAVGIPAKARKILTGDSPAIINAAKAELPQSNAARFAPLQPRPPEPGNWTLGEGGPGGSPQGGAPLGDLAAVLSHGVEQPGAAGLSSGPMGAPAPNGLPFQAPPESVGARFIQGGSPQLGNAVDDYGNQLDLQKTNSPGASWEATPAPGRAALGDRTAVPAQPESLGDLAAVSHQGRYQGSPVEDAMHPEDRTLQVGPGVPEGIATRTAPEAPVQHEVDEETGTHKVTSENGETHAQESGPFLVSQRSDTAATAQGRGEGVARAESLIQQAEARGLRYSSGVSVSPAMQRVYQALKRKGYAVMQNPAAKVNSTTGNLVSDDPRKPVFLVKSQLSQAMP